MTHYVGKNKLGPPWFYEKATTQQAGRHMSYGKLPTIDVDFWASRNPYYDKNVLSKEVKGGLSHSVKGGLLERFLPSIKSNGDLVALTIQRIRGFRAGETTDEALLIIFDLIQAWGGTTGRGPYRKTRGGGKAHRPNNSDFADIYRKGIEAILVMKNLGVSKEGIQMANSLICDLPYVGQSFSTKHLQFWSIGLNISPKLVIYDRRMELLLCAASRAKGVKYDYLEFLAALERLALELKVTAENLERALFAFSKNYFPNDSLVMNESPVHQNDQNAAATLSTWWSESADG